MGRRLAEAFMLGHRLRSVTRLGLATVVGVMSLGTPWLAAASRQGQSQGLVFSSTFAGDSDIYVAAPDGSGRVDVARDPHSDVTPRWSPDGRQIVFASNRSGTFEIFVMASDGSGVVQVTYGRGNNDAPTFTPDGSEIVYESRLGSNWEIRRIRTDGTGDTNLTRNRADDRYPAIAPNGRLIAFSSNRGSKGTHIWLMTIDGRSPHQLTAGRGSQTEPSWAPAGGRIAFVAEPSPTDSFIASVLMTGTRPRRLTASDDNSQRAPTWSPDGRSIVYDDCVSNSLTDCRLFSRSAGGRAVALSSLQAPLTISFDESFLPNTFWYSVPSGQGATNTQEGGKLITAVTADSTRGGPYDNVVAQWGTRCRMEGDFDVEADYQLLEWPAANGVAAMLASFAGPGNTPIFATRESQVWGELFSSWIPQSYVSQPTADTSGTLRIQRLGASAVASYLAPLGWVTIGSGPTIMDSAAITLGASSGTSFAHRDVKVAWDNLRINSGTINCPGQWWGDDFPDSR